MEIQSLPDRDNCRQCAADRFFSACCFLRNFDEQLCGSVSLWNRAGILCEKNAPFHGALGVRADGNASRTASSGHDSGAEAVRSEEDRRFTDCGCPFSETKREREKERHPAPDSSDRSGSCSGNSCVKF